MIHPMLTFKNWAHAVHVPSMHAMGYRAEHMIHDSHFWAIVGIISLLILFVVLAFLLSGEGNTTQFPYQYNPMVPYMP